jgi:hypothetical protein
MVKACGKAFMAGRFGSSIVTGASNTDAGRAYPLCAWEKLSFEYVLPKGVNDTALDARGA